MLCFALLAHQDEKALLQQIRNIRKYNGHHVKIVLYNGGKNPDFGKKVCKTANVMYCPYSRPLAWGKTGRSHYDVMRWLEENKVKYDYLAVLDSDVLFVRGGLEKWLEKQLNGYDCVLPVFRHETAPETTTWTPGTTMWKEWSRWKPFFNSSHFYGTFNPLQVYRHGIIRSMLARIDKSKLERLLRDTKVFALDEMIYITTAVLCGGRCKEYPKAVTQYLRPYPRISLEEAKAAKRNPAVMFVHPVKDGAVWKWICEQ